MLYVYAFLRLSKTLNPHPDLGIADIVHSTDFGQCLKNALQNSINPTNFFERLDANRAETVQAY